MLGTVNLVNNPWLGSLQALGVNYYAYSAPRAEYQLPSRFSSHPFSLPLNYCSVRMPLETFLHSVDSG